MPLYRMLRRVVYDRAAQEYNEVWGIDRVSATFLLPTKSAPRDTDRDDPLNDPKREPCGCTPLLTLQNGEWVTWKRMFEFLSEAEEAGYTLVSGFERMSPLSTLVLKGP